jgi:SAM-dependent methyltransferase
VEVEVSTFEAWEAAGRTFDAVVSGESWHWVDPVAGAAKAAEVLRPGGRLAVFWNTGQPPAGLDEAFADVYRRVLPESLLARLGKRSIEEAHSAMCAKAADGMRATGAFDEPAQWRFEWAQSYTRDEWLDALQTSGGAIPESQLADLLEGVGDAIDAAGGSFTMDYVTFVVTAALVGAPSTGARGVEAGACRCARLGSLRGSLIGTPRTRPDPRRRPRDARVVWAMLALTWAPVEVARRTVA